MRSIGVLGVPTSMGAHAPGQERAPAAFRDAGLVVRLTEHGLDVHDLGDLPRARWTPDTGSPRAQHADRVAEIAAAVADAVASARERAEPLLILGGDCTIEVGVVSGFARSGVRVGLVYLDAGPDLNVPSVVRLGFLDWMGTAHLLGLPDATPALSHLGPTHPILRPDQIVFVGAVPDELTEWEHRLVGEMALTVHWQADVTAAPVEVARAALAAFADDVDCILVHFDVDVVDFLDFPAADFPTINAGLTLPDALACVGEFTAHPKFAALTICEFNPDHVDEEQTLVVEFVERLVAVLPLPTDD